jgi:phosphoribosylformylglycinamidine synthase
LSGLGESDTVKALFNENIALVFQADASVEAAFAANNITIVKIGEVAEGDTVSVKNNDTSFDFQ